MDFATNADLLAELRDKLETAITTIKEEKELIFEGIGKLNDSWQGDSYEAFHKKCLSYEPAIESLIMILEAYDKMLETVETESRTLVTNIGKELGGLS